MKLQTQIPFSKADSQIDYSSRLLLLGSCFSQNIGDKLGYFKFRSLQNPLGILFHPLAIKNLIDRAVEQRIYTAKEIFSLNERWHCFDAHSALSANTQEGILQKLNDGLKHTNEQITEATHLCITLGTAWVYQHLDTDTIVANCHKVPRKEFEKRILSISEIVKSLEHLINQIRVLNKEAQIIFTVSPVRHLKDGFVENQRSKAHLVSAIHQLRLSTNGRNQNYFPAYELMMDELRDYRFYAQDMVHPNELAIGYIWEKFKEVWISEEVYPTMDKVMDIQKGISHKAFNPASEQHQKFQKSLKDKIAYIKEAYPFMEFTT
ncbi:GSCFA domain-containing protein [Maribacter aestuarii]|uniref:GSCFA domain-containing protein n=1 Tax=Maribacter aestuarii TaxID=1130723 RepID=UPI00248BEECA|nr:GSCFA domain-containing protein [Maribacter aestuarii]